MSFFRAFLLTILLWAGLYLPGLGGPELKGEEPRRILPAREMLRRENFVLPYSEGRPFHRKPPGINWAIAGSFALTGEQNEWTARLPSALALLALALTGLWAGKEIGGMTVGIALALSLLMNGGMIEKARLAEIESLYVSMAGAGMLLWAAAWTSGRGTALAWLITVIPFALANLTKGPVYLLFFYPIVFAALKRTGRLKDFLRPAHFISMVLSLAPMVYWGWLVKQQMVGMTAQVMRDDEGREILSKSAEAVWWQQIVGRLAFTNINGADWAQLPLRVLLLLAPWPVIAWLVSWRQRMRGNVSPPSDPANTPAANAPREAILRSALGWGSLISVVALCLLPATRSRYLMPALAPVCAWSVLTIFHLGLPLAGRKIWRGVLLVLMIAGTGAALALPWILKIESAIQATAWNAAGAVIPWALWRFFERQSAPLKLFLQTAPPLLLGSLIATTTIIPAARRHENVRPVAEQINALATNPGSIVIVNPGPQAFLFNLGSRCVELVKISEYPEDTAYVLLPPDVWAKADYKDRLVARGFTEILTKVKDLREETGREFLLIGRPKEPGN